MSFPLVSHASTTHTESDDVEVLSDGGSTDLDTQELDHPDVEEETDPTVNPQCMHWGASKVGVPR